MKRLTRENWEWLIEDLVRQLSDELGSQYAFGTFRGPDTLLVTVNDQNRLIFGIIEKHKPAAPPRTFLGITNLAVKEPGTVVFGDGEKLERDPEVGLHFGLPAIVVATLVCDELFLSEVCCKRPV